MGKNPNRVPRTSIALAVMSVQTEELGDGAQAIAQICPEVRPDEFWRPFASHSVEREFS